MIIEKFFSLEGEKGMRNLFISITDQAVFEIRV